MTVDLLDQSPELDGLSHDHALNSSLICETLGFPGQSSEQYDRNRAKLHILAKFAENLSPIPIPHPDWAS